MQNNCKVSLLITFPFEDTKRFLSPETSILSRDAPMPGPTSIKGRVSLPTGELVLPTSQRFLKKQITSHNKPIPARQSEKCI